MVYKFDAVALDEALEKVFGCSIEIALEVSDGDACSAALSAALIRSRWSLVKTSRVSMTGDPCSLCLLTTSLLYGLLKCSEELGSEVLTVGGDSSPQLFKRDLNKIYSLVRPYVGGGGMRLTEERIFNRR